MFALKDMIMGCTTSKPKPVKSSVTSIVADQNTAESERYQNDGMISKSSFILGPLLGEGGFGEVCAGMFVKSGEWFAVKRIRKSTLLEHKTGVPMLLNELKSMSRINHPLIVNLYFAFQDKRNCFFVMDLQIGGDLRYYLRKRYLFEEIDVAFYVACISSALDHLHKNGIIHRDIKPENILLDERGYPYLIDFGVAHVHQEWDSILSTNLASGTKQYLAPEVFTKTHLHGPEVDFWSLGVVAYELLWGKRPFEKHVPVPMITYLEKALSLKRKLTKEQKIRQMQSYSDGFLLASLENSNYPINTMKSNGVDSPVGLVRRPSQPKGSGSSSRTDKSNQTRVKRGSGNSSISINSGSTLTEKKTIYCSSVSYTIPNSNTNSVASNDHRTSNLLVSRASADSPKLLISECDSNDGGTTNSRHSRASSFDNTDEMKSPDPHHRSPMSPYSSPMTDRSPSSSRKLIQGIASTSVSAPFSPSKDAMNSPSRDGLKLPPVRARCSSPTGPLASSTPPRPLFIAKPNSFEAQGMMQIPELTDAPMFQSRSIFGDDHGLEVSMDNEHALSEDEESSTPGYIPGDHWLVDDGELPHLLKVFIPTNNPWLGDLSPPCVNVLQGLFDIRPSHRLGGRNQHLLESHEWFAMFGMDEEKLLNKQFKPHFHPGRRFLRGSAAARMEEISQLYQEGHWIIEDTDSEEQLFGNKGEEVPTAASPPVELTAEQDALFKDFRFISPCYHDFYRMDPAVTSLNK